MSGSVLSSLLQSNCLSMYTLSHCVWMLLSNISICSAVSLKRASFSKLLHIARVLFPETGVNIAVSITWVNSPKSRIKSPSSVFLLDWRSIWDISSTKVNLRHFFYEGKWLRSTSLPSWRRLLGERERETGREGGKNFWVLGSLKVRLCFGLLDSFPDDLIVVADAYYTLGEQDAGNSEPSQLVVRLLPTIHRRGKKKKPWRIVPTRLWSAR